MQAWSNWSGKLLPGGSSFQPFTGSGQRWALKLSLSHRLISSQACFEVYRCTPICVNCSKTSGLGLKEQHKKRGKVTCGWGKLLVQHFVQIMFALACIAGSCTCLVLIGIGHAVVHNEASHIPGGKSKARPEVFVPYTKNGAQYFISCFECP